MKALLTKDFKENTQRYDFNTVIDPEGILFQPQLIGHEIIGKNYYLSRKDMNSYLFSYMVKGHLNMIVGKDVYRVNAGSFIFLNCLLPHIFWVDEPEKGSNISAEFYYIHVFPTDGIKNLHNQVLNSSSVVNIGLDVGFVENVQSIMDLIKNNTYTEQRASEIFYSFLLKFQAETNRGMSKQFVLHSSLALVINFIASHYKEKISVNDCAKIAFLSPSYLQALFTKHYGISLLKYIQHFRFQKASSLLLHSNKKISVIAAEVGLYDSQALIRLFKEMTEMTPLQYRQYNK